MQKVRKCVELEDYQFKLLITVHFGKHVELMLPYSVAQPFGVDYKYERDIVNRILNDCCEINVNESKEVKTSNITYILLGVISGI